MEARQNIESAIAKQRRQRGAAVLDGKRFDSSAIAALETDIAALDDAQTVQVQRERTASEIAGAKRLADITAKISKLWQDRQAQIGRAERALRDFFGAVKEANRIDDLLRPALVELGGNIPALAHTETAMRFGGRLSAIGLAETKQHRLGHVAFASASLFDPTRSWIDEDQQLIGKHIERLTKGERKNG